MIQKNEKEALQAIAAGETDLCMEHAFVRVKAIAAALPNSKISLLSLRNCLNIFEDAEAIALALPNSNVTILDLSSNRISDEGVEALAAALPNSKVTTLDLEGTPISVTLQERLHEILAANQARAERGEVPPALLAPTTIVATDDAHIIAAQRRAALEDGKGI